ncbi:hypothetical protein [Ruficoccus sp. ZRK36]|uniref:hypothetical protein n=1 Tax=Ruficoccus sp. ZRK36 TaxID=2866311 RepID=UPI001C7360D0|nr:hypothetical protein [Ruficoccus sp. ZRK36]QYY34466.1 hypothetical protein K0V07_09105 [Ruficoccus sp. ZRK36]
MSIRAKSILTITGLTVAICTTQAGVYSGPSDIAHAIDPAVHYTSTKLAGWAETVADYSPTDEVSASYATPDKALGYYNTGTVSLGDLSSDKIATGVTPGSITLGFGAGFSNGDGWDFAVFENGFTSGNNLFMELAYVEVSTNGVDFARFDSISTNTSSAAGSGAFSYYDTTNVYNLAGKSAGGYGTTFDLNDLLDHQLVIDGIVDLDAINYVRLVDIPGDGSYLDSEGNPIIDNYHTSGSGGLDLRAIGYAYAVPEPRHYAMLAGALALVLAWLRRRTR